jgi:hypothetical protein
MPDPFFDHFVVELHNRLAHDRQDGGSGGG